MVVLRSMFESAVVVMTLVGAMSGATVVASASPADESTEAADCQYVLTSPELVIMPGGAKSVRATMTPKTCTPNAQPTGVFVCLSTPISQGSCKRLPGWATAEVIIPATSPDGTYTATGEVCWQDILGSFRSDCRTAGPVNSTL
jgi:hypothetical protein